jgi:hypothetical protein
MAKPNEPGLMRAHIRKAHVCPCKPSKNPRATFLFMANMKSYASAAGRRESRPQSPPRGPGNTIAREIAVEKPQQVLKQQGAFIGRDQAVSEGA